MAAILATLAPLTSRKGVGTTRRGMNRSRTYLIDLSVESCPQRQRSDRNTEPADLIWVHDSVMNTGVPIISFSLHFSKTMAILMSCFHMAGSENL